MNSNNQDIYTEEVDTITPRKRGNILYYSTNQVANLLGEDDTNIRYYTNVFDNILKIEISNKEFRYTSKDIDKLEFLINLKNKGMTIKEIQNYCEALPLDIEELVEIKGNSDWSVQSIVSLVKEEESKQLNLLKEDLLNELKQYIDYKFDMEYKTNKDLYNELSIKISNLAYEKNSLQDDIKLQLSKFNEVCITRDSNLLDEIRRFKNVIEQAYYIQQEMELQKEKTSFIGKLFGIR